MSQSRSLVRAALGGGFVLAVALAAVSGPWAAPAPQAVAQVGVTRGGEIAQLKAELEKLKAETINAAAMNEVDYHAQNLWFAGKAANWPLADYYWKKTLVHMRMALGEDLATARGDIERTGPDVLAAVENRQNMQVGRAIERKDVLAFNSSYRALLEGCYNCHKAQGLPFLRPRMPVKPAQAIINVDPRATWPN